MAEIEHFRDPNDKRYAAFQNVRDEVLCLFSGEVQLTTDKTQLMKIGDGVAQKLVDNQARGGRRTARPLEGCMDPERLRFLQHLKTAGSSRSSLRTAGSSASVTLTAREGHQD